MQGRQPNKNSILPGVVDVVARFRPRPDRSFKERTDPAICLPLGRRVFHSISGRWLLF